MFKPSVAHQHARAYRYPTTVFNLVREPGEQQRIIFERVRITMKRIDNHEFTVELATVLLQCWHDLSPDGHAFSVEV